METNQQNQDEIEIDLLEHNCRIQGADPAVQQARLALCIGVKNVIFNVLTMFKINVPEKM